MNKIKVLKKKKSLLIILSAISCMIFLSGTVFAMYYLIPAPLNKLIDTDNIDTVLIETLTPYIVEGEERDSVQYEKRQLSLDSNNIETFIEAVNRAKYNRQLFIDKRFSTSKIIISYHDESSILLRQEYYCIYNSNGQADKERMITLDNTLYDYFELCRNQGDIVPD